jgi:hypothetical protein
MKVDQFSSAALDAGIYQLTLLEVDPNQKSAKEDPMILLKWEENESRTQVWDRLVVTPSAAWKLAQLWVALGGSSEDEVGDLASFSSSLVAKVNSMGAVFAKLCVDDWQGKKRNKVAEYLTAKDGEILRSAQGRAPF